MKILISDSALNDLEAIKEYYLNEGVPQIGLGEGRYKATLLDSESYLLTCSRYIELNPVRAGMVNDPAEYPWSSYHFNALGKENSLLTPHSVYKTLGVGEISSRTKYRALFSKHIPNADIEAIRNATNKAWVLGNDRFRDKVEKLLSRQVQPKPRGGDRRSESFLKKDQTNRA